MKKLIVPLALVLALASVVQAGSKKDIDTPAFDKAIAQQMIQASIQRFEIAEDVSVEDAIASMQLRANMLNFKLVADLPLSEQVEAMGQDANYMRILAFCDALIAKKMHASGVCHRDFYICHFLVRGEGDDRLTVIDLHRALVKKHLGSRWIVKDIGSLYFSAMDIGLTRRDLYRFIREYTGKPLGVALTEQKAFWEKVSGRARWLKSRH